MGAVIQVCRCHVGNHLLPQSRSGRRSSQQFQRLSSLFACLVMLSSCRLPSAPELADIPTKVDVNVTCNELSFYLDPSLGRSFECLTVPESSDSDIPMDIFIYPAHTELIIGDYPLTNTQFPPMIYVYPLDSFKELLPDVIPRRISDLESLISDGTLNNPVLPFLPPIPLEQIFSSQKAILSISGGQGVRYITQYNEFDNLISNRTVVYTYQGITDNGLYWVAVTLPISSPVLPEDDFSPWPPEDYTPESWIQYYDTYVDEVEKVIGSQSPDSFYPTINTLDDLITSITVE